MNNLKDIYAVIFDFDGVIVNTDLIHEKAWKYVCKNHNLIYNSKCSELTKGFDRVQSLKNILRVNKCLDAYTDEMIFQLCAEKNKVYCEYLKNVDNKIVNPFFYSLVESLKKQNIKIGLASSSKNARRIIDKLGLTNYFDAVVTGMDIKLPKPDPEPYINCINILSLNKEYCLAVEDALSGIEAAQKAGLTAIYIGVQNVCIKSSDLSFKNLEEFYNYMISKQG